MKYTVKSKEGELTYGSLAEVQHARVLGLVDPEDEVLEEGKTTWRKAGSIPLLVTAAKVKDEREGAAQQRVWIILALILSLAALYLLAKKSYIYGGLFGGLASLVLIHVSTLAFRLRR